MTTPMDPAAVESDLEDFDRLKDLILTLLPYAIDDGEDPPDEANPEECVKYAADEIARLRKDREGSIDWYQQRFNRLRRWVKEEVEPFSEDVARRYFAICANGSPSPHESADWRETMHGLSLQRDSLRAEAAIMRNRIAVLREALEDIREWAHHEDILTFEDGDISLADFCGRALNGDK